MKSDPILTPSIKTNSKWIVNLNVRTKTIQLIKEISQLCDLGLDSDFLAKYQKHAREEEFGIHQNAELSPFKKHNQKSENTNQRMDKNTYKPYI